MLEPVFKLMNTAAQEPRRGSGTSGSVYGTTWRTAAMPYFANPEALREVLGLVSRLITMSSLGT